MCYPESPEVNTWDLIPMHQIISNQNAFYVRLNHFSPANKLNEIYYCYLYVSSHHLVLGKKVSMLGN